MHPLAGLVCWSAPVPVLMRTKIKKERGDMVWYGCRAGQGGSGHAVGSHPCDSIPSFGAVLTFGRVGLLLTASTEAEDKRVTAETRHHPPQLQIKTTGTVILRSEVRSADRTGQDRKFSTA